MGIHNAYPPEVHALVKEWCTKLRDQELAEKCNRELGTNFTKLKMRQFRHNHHYLCGRHNLEGEEYWQYQTKWPKGMIDFIRENSWGTPSKDMAEMVNEKFGTDFTPHRMKVFRAKWHIKSGITGWYRKGHPPGNKGKKWDDYLSPEMQERSRKTQFKKGQKPINEVPVGEIRKRKDGFLYYKKAMEGSYWDRWELYHRRVWKEHNGEIPRGMAVSFKDGNRENCDISNLMLTTRAESAVLTRLRLRSECPELTDTGLAYVKVLMRVNKEKEKRRKKHGRQKSDMQKADRTAEDDNRPGRP